jgi:polyhydroxyalkanoate synthesis regulator phasin
MPRPARKLPTILCDQIEEQSSISRWRNVISRVESNETALRAEITALRQRCNTLERQVTELLRESLRRDSGIGGAR